MALAELQPQVLPPMDPEMVVPLQDDMKNRGVTLELGSGIRSITKDAAGNATGVELTNGKILSGSLIILDGRASEHSIRGCGLDGNWQDGRDRDEMHTVSPLIRIFTQSVM